MGNESRSDHELIEAMNAGDARAFDALVSRHERFALAVAARFAPPGDAEDVVQEVLVYLLGKFAGPGGFVLAPGTKLTTFLYPALKHAGLARRRKHRPVGAEPETLEALAGGGAGGGQIGSGAGESAEGMEAIRRAVGRLPEDHRETLLLRFVDGLPLADVATALGLPVGTVKSRLHNAVAMLREDATLRAYLGPDGTDSP